MAKTKKTAKKSAKEKTAKGSAKKATSKKPATKKPTAKVAKPKAKVAGKAKVSGKPHQSQKKIVDKLAKNTPKPESKTPLKKLAKLVKSVVKATTRKPEPVEESKAKSKKAASKVEDVSVSLDVPEEAEQSEEVVLTDAEGRRYCRVKDCDQLASVDSYCRYHYLLFWKKIQVRKKILSEGKLERYIEDLTARYPDKFLDMLRKDLRSEKEFLAAIQELEIDESAVDSEFEDEAQNYLDEVRGMGEASGSREEEDF